MTVTEVWVADGHTRLERLADVSGVAETPLGTVWIASSTEILAVDPSDPSGARDVMVTERKGDGPGELLGAERIAITPDGDVAVHDLGRGAIEIYSAVGEPLRRVPLPFSVTWTKGFAVLASGDFVLSGGVPWIEAGLHHFSAAGEHLGSWADAAQAEEWLARVVGTGGALHALTDGSLLYSSGAPHSVVRYEPPPTGGGEPVGRTVSEMPALLEAPGDAVLVKGVDEEGVRYTSFDIWYPQSHAVFGLDGGRVLNVIRRRDGGGDLETVRQLFEPNHEGPDAGTHALAAKGIVKVPVPPMVPVRQRRYPRVPNGRSRSAYRRPLAADREVMLNRHFPEGGRIAGVQCPSLVAAPFFVPPRVSVTPWVVQRVAEGRFGGRQ
ncbi:hypothetical protein [Candidatus Palauibacter sp.]|uniref:hypothetical protein n=1 Tax=Candidatus Palauibacter sp. TaxID=3101350 RepID=UPI003C7054A8